MSSVNKTTTDESANSTVTNSVPDSWNHIPCVQYGFADGKGPKRSPKFQTIFEPIPDGAETASPVYMLSRDQYEYQRDLDNPYKIKGDSSSIATELQNECEADSRVLYPVHMETDSYHEYEPTTILSWFRTFLEQHLDVSLDECTLYFSGSRSIHVHVPRFVESEAELAILKQVAETFCEETEAEFDCGIYSRKRLFRLPGVSHSSTGLHKVEIKSDWNKNRIFREANQSKPTLPESYEQVLRRVFTEDPSVIHVSTPNPVDPQQDLFHLLDSEKAILSLEPDRKQVETPLIEQEEYPEDLSEVPRWAQYRTRWFSPYALSSGGARSVAVVKVKGTPFAREDITIGDRNTPAHAVIPSYFYGARGCAGEEFTKEDQHAPLQLSKADYGKWDYDVGDNVVIIGGQSRSSVINKVTSWQATVVGHALTGEGASREAALDYLESEGIDIGSAGASQPTSGSSNSSTSRSRSSTTCRTSMSETEAARLQRIAEEDGIHLLGYPEIVKVSNRLLQMGGWSLAWNWLEGQFGDQFKPDKTRAHLKRYVEKFDDLHHVTVPPK